MMNIYISKNCNLTQIILSGKRLKHGINKTRKKDELSAEGVIVMTKGEYESLANWRLQWNP